MHGVWQRRLGVLSLFLPSIMIQPLFHLQDIIFIMPVWRVQVSPLEENVFTFLHEAIKKSERYQAVFVDPPWPDDSLNRNRFSLADIQAPIETLLTRAISISPVVAMRLRHATQPDELEILGKDLDRKIEVHTPYCRK